MSADPESSWRLLFDIALSHGVSLKLQKLTYAGLNVFLQSATLLGPETGVFPLLIERLWHQHSRPVPPAEKEALFGRLLCDDDNSLKYQVVRLEGFTDIMKVVSVRCYQTRKLSQLCTESDTADCDLRRAIVLSAEDHVRLEESVAYTAGEYLKVFIFRNTIHPTSLVSLSLAQITDSTWTPHTRQLVRYVVEHLRLSVVKPLFLAHSGAVESGCMSYAEFEAFVQSVFPCFTRPQQAGAFSIFDYDGLVDVQQFLALCVVETDDRGNDIATHGEKTEVAAALRSSLPLHGSQRSSHAFGRPRLIGLDGFVDAMLMLSVVAFANEKDFPRHRPITAKVWSTFEDYYCPAAAKLKSCFSPREGQASPFSLSDPLILLNQGSDAPPVVVPTLSLVYPLSIPADRVSSVFLSGLALYVDPERCVPRAPPAEGPAETAPPCHSSGREGTQPPRLLREPVKPRTSVRVEPPTKEVDESLNFSSENSVKNTGKECEGNGSTAFLTDVAAECTDERVGVEGAKLNTDALVAKNGTASTVVTQAAMLFTSCLDDVRRRAHSRLKGKSAYLPEAVLPCHVFVDEEDVTCMLWGPNQVEALLPLSEWQKNLKFLKLQVTVEHSDEGSADGDENSGFSVTYTPCRHVPISLRDATGDQTYSSVDVTIALTPDTQRLPREIIMALRTLFEQHAAAAAAATSDAAFADSTTASFEAMVSFALAAGLARPACAEDAVRAAVNLARSGRNLFTFTQALAVIAMLPCTQQLGGDAYTVPNLVSSLRVALANRGKSSPVDSDLHRAAAAATDAVPYNGIVEVPYKAAYGKRSTAARESADQKESLFKELREARERARAERTGSGPNRVLPPFPSHLSTNPLYTRQLTDRNKGESYCAAEQGLKSVANFLQTEFIQRQLVIDPSKTIPRKGEVVSSLP